jgi:hypothetical protein
MPAERIDRCEINSNLREEHRSTVEDCPRDHRIDPEVQNLRAEVAELQRELDMLHREIERARQFLDRSDHSSRECDHDQVLYAIAPVGRPTPGHTESGVVCEVRIIQQHTLVSAAGRLLDLIA